MPRYKATEGIDNGMPLGGIGAGAVELLPDGRLANYTFRNNWTTPGQEIIGAFFAVHAESDGRAVTKVLQTAPVRDIQGVKDVAYEASFPFAELKYQEPQLGFNLGLRASSYFIPGDYKHSSMPCARFEFTADGADKPVTISILMSFRNICGRWNVGRYNTLNDTVESTAVTMSSKAKIPFDQSAGDMTMALPKSSEWENDWIDACDLKTNPFKLAHEFLNVSHLDEFKKSGRLGRLTSNMPPLQGERIEYGACLAARFKLKPSQTVRVPFFLTWNFPVHEAGHSYCEHFHDSMAAASYALENDNALRHKTMLFVDTVRRLDAPDWLKDALLNNLYVLFSAAWHGKDGLFTLYEAPLECPLMGTLDVFFYASAAVSMLFPEFEKIQLRLFAQAQRQDGYVPHDLGRNTVSCPSDGTTSPPRWKDLPSKFVILVYRHHVWHKDPYIIEEFYPAAKKAMQWIMAADKNGDCLPDNEGQDQTFDDWPFYSTNSYTSSLFLCALEAAAEMARIKKDETFYSECREWAAKGRESFERMLYNGSFYISYVSDQKRYEVCTGGQIMGELFARMCKLPSIQPAANVTRAIKEILRLNHSVSGFGLVNAVFPDGTPDYSSSQSGSIWPGVNYAAAALAVSEGFVDDGLAVAQKMWSHVAQTVKRPFNQADNIDSRTGKFLFGDHYMRNMAVWLIPWAAASIEKPSGPMRRFLENLRA